MKAFLGTATETASRLRALPVELKLNASVLNQIKEYWIPVLELYFGSLEKFLSLLPRTEGGYQALEKVIQAGAIDTALRGNIEHLLQEAVFEYQEQSQQVTFLTAYSLICHAVL